MAPWLLQVPSLQESPEQGIHQQVNRSLSFEFQPTNNIQHKKYPDKNMCFLVRDGVPYCERDYQMQFGVQCEMCQNYITGKVLEVRPVSIIVE